MTQSLKILDTPQWEGLTASQQRLVGTIYGGDTGDGFTTVLTPGARNVVKALEAKGLLAVEWRERDATIRLRPEGWPMRTRIPVPMVTPVPRCMACPMVIDRPSVVRCTECDATLCASCDPAHTHGVTP